MADFMDEEADVSSGSESGSDSESDDRRKSEGRSKRAIIDSSEEDEDDGDGEDLKDLIDDNVEEDVDSGGEDDGEKRKHEDSEIESELSEDDLALIEENLGIKLDKKKKRKRIRMMSDDEDSGTERPEEDGREAIQHELFDGSDQSGGSDQEVDERPPSVNLAALAAPPAKNYDVDDSDDDSDVNDFIVDEDGQPVSKAKKKKNIIHEDADLQRAQDIFGVDFDFDEFDQYGDEYDEDEDDEEDEEGLIDDDDVEGEPRAKKPGKKSKRKTTKTTIFDVFEPSELERGHFTDVDQDIRATDMPERFQLRSIPVCMADDMELDEEADWMFRYAFTTRTVSQQDTDSNDTTGNDGIRAPTTINKIKAALGFIRNQQFEVPFIAFYRKECIEPELNINDLWKVYQWDEKWMQIRNRKQNLLRLYERMQQYQFDIASIEGDLDENFRTITEEDLDRVRHVQTMEELQDVYKLLMLYYGREIPKMKAAAKQKKAEAIARGEAVDDDDEAGGSGEALKQASRNNMYTMCVQAGLAQVASKFGLSAQQFAENLEHMYQKNDIVQDPAEPNELAQEFIAKQFKTSGDVMQGATYMVAMQIAHDPTVRKIIRQAFREGLKISCAPTKKGLKLIDEGHSCSAFKFLEDKLCRDLVNDQFLKLTMAKEEGLLEFELYLDSKKKKTSRDRAESYLDEIKHLYQIDEFSNLVQEWNNYRLQALDRALNMVLYPQLIKEFEAKLLEEAKDHITRSCCRKLYSWLKVAPFTSEQYENEDEDWSTAKGIRVLGISYETDKDLSSFGALIDGDGIVTDFIKLQFLMLRKNSWRERERELKESDMEKLKDFISSKKPHVIAICAMNREATSVVQDIQNIVRQLEQEEQLPAINVELVDSELSTVYMHCNKSEQDYREYPTILRQAVSIARRIQDPLIEFCQLCNADEDILSLKYHLLQDSVHKDTLLNALYLEFVNRVNEVGVDVNRCVMFPHTMPLIQFVCGLGPRKGFHLIKTLKQQNQRLENRTQLVMVCSMGPKVFFNCAGFIKIDTNSLGDSTDAYVEVLDGSRVHPETYEWARKMAVDALEYDDTAEDANPAGALEEILDAPERLKDLDLDAFAEELERQSYGDKHITLYDIRAELNNRYKDLRTPYRSPTPEEVFNMLTKETPQTFYIGRLVMCTVTGIAHRRPQMDQLEEAHPVRDDDTGLWQCPFCNRKDFTELSEVWSHFDADQCPGPAVGVKTRMDSGINGFVHIKNLSDKKVTNPEDRVKIGMTVHSRITKIDIERFQVEMSCKSSDLADNDNKWKLPKDDDYDYAAEALITKKETEKEKQKARQTYVKRVIAHPSFHNVDFRSSERLLESLEQGDVIIRPSSKGTDRLTLTWKVSQGIHSHIDVREEGKENAFSLGSQLIIGNEEFEDLDEIIARHIQPMAAFARDIMNYRYYQAAEGGKREILEKLVIDEKKKAPSRIPYILSASQQYPGKFLLSYMPRKSVKFEFVSVTPNGMKYREHVFTHLSSMIRWFKEHFRDPIPITTRTPAVNVGATPGVAAGVFGTPAYGSNYMQSTMTPVMTPGAVNTPRVVNTPGYNNVATPRNTNTPWTTSGTPAPSRTPARTPSSRTPRRTGSTPNVGVAKDWGKAAEMWAQAKQTGGRRTPGRTPGRTPSRTPSRTPQRVMGDATPLFDER